MNKKEIQEIYHEFHTPKHIIAHMKMVAKVAKTLSKKIIAKGIKIDQELIENAALLHDVVRCVDFKNIEEKVFRIKPKNSDLECWKKLWKKYHKVGHEKAMAKILRARGHKKLANLISKHGFFSIWELKTIEEKILYYSDKRVDRDKIVTLEVRFSEGEKRNGSPKDDPELVISTKKKIYELEQEFREILGKSIDQI